MDPKNRFTQADFDQHREHMDMTLPPFHGDLPCIDLTTNNGKKRKSVAQSFHHSKQRGLVLQEINEEPPEEQEAPQGDGQFIGVDAQANHDDNISHVYWVACPSLPPDALVCLNNLRNCLPVRPCRGRPIAADEVPMKSILRELDALDLPYRASAGALMPTDLYTQGGPVEMVLQGAKGQKRINDREHVYAVTAIMPKQPMPKEKLYFMRAQDLQVYLQMTNVALATQVQEMMMYVPPMVTSDILHYACQKSDISVKQ